MAARTFKITEVTSDLSGEEAEDQIDFALNGIHYHLDLTVPESQQFHDILARYLAVAQVRRRKAAEGNGSGNGKIQRNSAAVRVWAAETGIPLHAQGRIPNKVWAQYEALFQSTG